MSERYVLIAEFDCDPPLRLGDVDHEGLAGAIVRHVPGAVVTRVHHADLRRADQGYRVWDYFDGETTYPHHEWSGTHPEPRRSGVWSRLCRWLT